LNRAEPGTLTRLGHDRWFALSILPTSDRGRIAIRVHPLNWRSRRPDLVRCHQIPFRGVGVGAVVAEFVRFTLDDGSQVVFESAESNLVALHGGQPDVSDGGRLQTRLEAVAGAADQVAESLRSRLRPEEISLEFGLKVSGEVNWWFFAKNQAEGTIKVTLTWKPESQAQAGHSPLAEP
jgi:NTP-dependent ternary system trypsin peptidase co-occuring protein